MLRTLTSLSFLYAFVILVLFAYGFLYYRDFKKGVSRRRFPFVFLAVAVASFFFLWTNIHAPLSLKTFSNLDHHFIRHEGFVTRDRITIGRSDTVLNPNDATNIFSFSRQNGNPHVTSSYSEEPFYVLQGGRYRILSNTYRTNGLVLSFRIQQTPFSLQITNDNQFSLKAGDQVFQRQLDVRKGISLWDLFKSDESFLVTSHYNDYRVVGALRNILLVRDSVARRDYGALRCFFSGRLFDYTQPTINGQSIPKGMIAFGASLKDGDAVAWGIGFLENNRNQYRVTVRGTDSIALLSRYPVAYPLTEENRSDWSAHRVTKFLSGNPADMQSVPGIFREGFLFNTYARDTVTHFPPLILSYQKGAKNEPLALEAKRLMDNPAKAIPLKNDLLEVQVNDKSAAWLFRIANTYDWEYAGFTLPAKTWQLALFGSLAFFFLLVMATAWIVPAQRQSWIWQLLACIVLVLLTTRFFLYWRYKSFPPFEGMDLPSQQQLLSFSNFGIILAATVVLALLFGFSTLKAAYFRIRQLPGGRRSYYAPLKAVSNNQSTLLDKIMRHPVAKKLPLQAWYFISWFLLLAICGAAAALSGFNPATCRHIAIAFVIIYFGYLFVSYRYSPLATTSDKSWWRLATGRSAEIIISNPVKILLSVSLLALFVFIDIGFAIVFLNFLLFNEAFLCVNYAIAGLSAGSRRNAGLFGVLGLSYLLFFVLNLLYAPYIFKFLLELPQAVYIAGYLLFAGSIAYVITRLFAALPPSRKRRLALATASLFFLVAFFFFPKERILEKAAMTKYRIDVLTTPVEKAIVAAYTEGKTYEPVIRAAQNQWFINTFIDEENNPGIHSPGFNLLQHAQQNKGAKYNAQATDLVASRFLLGEHGQLAVLLYVLLLLVPAMLLASFYKLYPDFTNRVNADYPLVTAGFSVLNYLLITALMVILAATGRYIFFGQDLPFGSILSKQSVLFPSLLIILSILFFRHIPAAHYANTRKLVPGLLVFVLLAVMLWFVRPGFNRNKEFAVANIATELDGFVQQSVQPLLTYFDTAAATRRLSYAKKDKLFTDSLRQLLNEGRTNDGNPFFISELRSYANTGLVRHLDQRKLLYLDLHTGRPEIAVNRNYFRVDAPPHLQQLWTGNLYGDSLTRNISIWNSGDDVIRQQRIRTYHTPGQYRLDKTWSLSVHTGGAETQVNAVYLVNSSSGNRQLIGEKSTHQVAPGDSLLLPNPSRYRVLDDGAKTEGILSVEPDAFMRNYYVNGSRYYVYPLGERFTWARNFAEAISPDFRENRSAENAFVSLDYELTDSLTSMISDMMASDTSYHNGAEYAICIADASGRIVAMPDFIKNFERPDPNDKAVFNKVIAGENGFAAQSLLRKQIGNLNLLRMNPGPGSTFKPIVFSAIASQLAIAWEQFSSDGFTEKQHFFAGMKVPEYDFEKNNGHIANINDYLKYSDNYYHANVLLLGSYPKQDLAGLLSSTFTRQKPGEGLKWPWFSYEGQSYWMDGFKNWPGYESGQADFGSDSSFTAIGLLENFGISVKPTQETLISFKRSYDSLLLGAGAAKSGFILPETAVFDQHGGLVNHRNAYDLFTSCFRGHVKGSSQVMVPPVKMLEAFGRLVSQNKTYSLTLDPYAAIQPFSTFYVDNHIAYNRYLSIVKEDIFGGMRDALFAGTAVRLGSLLKAGATPYYYYGKTGTTGDDQEVTKSKLFSLVISARDVSAPGFEFRNNPFYTIYFTSQNGPAKQNEEFQARVIRMLEATPAFKHYMKGKK